jgi:hypothetical protein
MALTSPGVEVSVIDESFYTPAEPGTRPLFIVASAENKQNGSGTGIARGTLSSNAGRVFLITSQRDLVETFGDPVFKTDSNNNPVHAGEQNEYGLQAAYSFLGVSNSALVVRADLDLGALDPTPTAPGGEPQDGTFWLNTGSTVWGVFQWDGRPVNPDRGQNFTSKTPTVILDSSKLTGGAPKPSIGAIGDYAITPIPSNPMDTVTADNHLLALWFKSRHEADGSVGSATWVKVGTDDWVTAWPTIQGSSSTGTIPSGIGINLVLSVNGDAPSNIPTAPGDVNDLADTINGFSIPGVAARVVDGRLEIYATNTSVDRITIGQGSNSGVLTQAGLTAGVYYAPKLQMSPHTSVPTWRRSGAGQTPRPTGSVWIKTTEPNQGARIRVNKYNSNTQLWQPIETPIYESSTAALAGMDPDGGGAGLPVDSCYLQYNFNEFQMPVAEFRVMRRRSVGQTVIRSAAIEASGPRAGTYSFQMTESLIGNGQLATPKLITVTLTGATSDADVVAGAISSANFVNIVTDVDSNNRIVVAHRAGGEIRFSDLGDSTTFVSTILGFNNNVNVYSAGSEDNVFEFVASNWIPLTITPDTPFRVLQSYYISNDAPETLVPNNTLWYSSVVDEADIMIHNGAIWVGYLDPTSPFYNADADERTDPNGPLVSATQPTSQSDGSELKTGDLWIDTSDIENYPNIKKYDADFGTWISLDLGDQTTENGVLFADARAGTSGGSADTAPGGTIPELLTSNYVDFDAPDPALYPRGMLLFNLRRSGFNVKKFKRQYIDLTSDNIRYKADFNDIGEKPTSGDSQGEYYPHRWVTESGNQANGAGSFGRKAQRKVIQQALQALVNSNDAIRDTERNTFNLLACPGYPELIGEMISLNYDRGVSAFVVGDSPARLRPDATSLNEWGTNAALALEDNDAGLASSDEYLGIFYPWGFTSDNFGRDIAVPPSHMILRMMALSDQVSYPWFAPAGTRRGGITNATAVGYISDEGEFISVALNEGQRDTLYNVKVNPITFFVGAGLVNFGQKTRARNASALDRINVARLVIYLRSQLNKLAKPYIFEPNDKITRDEIKQQVESLLLELVGLRALYDFLVVCDESNNTPNRIDRNELYVDIAIEPVKAVEFIYIPVRLKNTGEIAGL